MALLRCSFRRGMYLRRCEGDVGASRLVVLFRKIVGVAGSLYARRPGGSSVSVAVSPSAPPGAAVGVGKGLFYGMNITRDLARLHNFVDAVCMACSGVLYAPATVVHHSAAAA